MPENIEIYDLKTLQRLIELNDTACKSVESFRLTIVNDSKNGVAIVKECLSCITKFTNLNKIDLNLEYSFAFHTNITFQMYNLRSLIFYLIETINWAVSQ